MNASVDWGSIPGWLQVAIVALMAVQVSLLIYALVKLFRTPDERLQFGKKWPWVVIIVFVNLVGPIVFLAVGRKPAQAADPLAAERADRTAHPAGDTSAPPADRAARAAEVLYGSSDGDAS